MSFSNLYVGVFLWLGMMSGVKNVFGQDEAIACNSTSRPAVLSNYTGGFTSPGFPSNYPDNANCEWRITNPETDGTLMLDFPMIQTEEGDRDWVEIFDGNSATGGNGIFYCGNFTNVTTVFSSQQNLYVVFASDSNTNFAGFEAKYTRETACKSPRELDTPNGWFSSPYYPLSYTVNKTCEWRLTFGSDEIAEIWFDAFDVGIADCSFGYLEVKSPNETRRLCGSSKPNNIVLQATASFVFTSHISTPANTGQGFIAFYRIDARPATTTTATTTTTALSTTASATTTTTPTTTSVTRTTEPTTTSAATTTEPKTAGATTTTTSSPTTTSMTTTSTAPTTAAMTITTPHDTATSMTTTTTTTTTTSIPVTTTDRSASKPATATEQITDVGLNNDTTTDSHGNSIHNTSNIIALTAMTIIMISILGDRNDR